MKEVFGIGCTSLGVFFDGLKPRLRDSRRMKDYTKLKTSYVTNGNKKVSPSAQLVLVDTLAVAKSVAHLIPKDAIVVVSDSPLLLAEIEGITPLDWEAKVSYRFILKQVDYDKVIKSLTAKTKTKFKALSFKELDFIGMTVDEISEGQMLGSVMAMINQMSFARKKEARAALGKYLRGEVGIPYVEEKWKDLTKGKANMAVTERAIKSVAKTGPKIAKALKYLNFKTNRIAGASKKFGVDKYELNVLLRLANEHKQQPTDD